MPAARTCLLVLVMLAGCDHPSPVADAGPPPITSVVPMTHTYRSVRHGAAEWITFDLDLKTVELSLVGQAENEPHTLPALGPFLAPKKRELVMATNAGIFSPSRRPMGLHIQHGQELAPLSTADGEGNFFLKPNGVFHNKYDASKCSLQGHEGPVYGLAITPDNGFIVSVSWDRTLRIWHIETGKQVAMLEAHAPLLCCAVSPDGKTILAGDEAGGLHILDWHRGNLEARS